MSDVRTELARLIAAGLAGRKLDTLFEMLRHRFRQAGQNLAPDSFIGWVTGKAFPFTQLRQDLLGDEIGGDCGQRIKQLKAPPFRKFARKKMKEADMVRRLREFPVVMRPYGDKLVPQGRITCALCGRTYHHHRRGSFDDIDYFHAKGWEIGTSETHDFCPRCIEARSTKATATRLAAELDTTGKVVRMTDHKKPEVPATNVVDQIPKLDGRLLFHSIEQHWDDSANRYKSGWSDSKIAEDDGKPVAWVKAIRERDFGGTGDDPAAQEFIKRTLKLENESAELERARDELDEVKAVVERQMADASAALAKADRLGDHYKEKHLKWKTELHKLLELAKQLEAPPAPKKANG